MVENEECLHLYLYIISLDTFVLTQLIYILSFVVKVQISLI